MKPKRFTTVEAAAAAGVPRATLRRSIKQEGSLRRPSGSSVAEL